MAHFCLSTTRHGTCRILGPGLHMTEGVYTFLFQKSKLLALLDIPPLSIAKCHPHPDSHDSQRWHQKYNHALTDSFSPVFRGCLGRAAAHGTPLAESGRCPQEDKHAENGEPMSHFTPR